VSSHLMSEMALTAEQLIIIGRGRLMADVSVAQLTGDTRRSVRVRSPQAGLLSSALAGPRVTVRSAGAGVLDIEGVDSETVGRIAHSRGIALYELVPREASLEEAFMELTRGAVEYRASAPAGRSTS
jgi:ABC-2 type transport system ATP-binding protein